MQNERLSFVYDSISVARMKLELGGADWPEGQKIKAEGGVGFSRRGSKQPPH